MKTTLCPHIKQPGILLLFLTVAGLSTPPAMAEMDLTGLYTGLQYSSSEFQVESAGVRQTVSNGHIKAKLGKVLSETFAVEGQFGLTTNSNEDLGTLTYGGYLRAGKDFGQYKPYGLVGFSGYYSYDDVADSESETSGSLGVGLEIFGRQKDIAITIEFLRLADKTVNGADVTFDVIGIGFTYYFTEDKSYFNKNRNKVRSIRY